MVDTGGARAPGDPKQVAAVITVCVAWVPGHDPGMRGFLVTPTTVPVQQRLPPTQTLATYG